MSRSRPLTVVQITDPHLGAPSEGMYGVTIDTGATLARVLADIRARCPQADLMLATGDLAERPVPATYAQLRKALSGLPMPVHCLPGNHDEPQVMEEALADAPGIDCARVITREDWVVVMLDSTIPGHAGGALDADELEFLEETLSRHPARNALICLHHPVVAVGSRWMDRMKLADAGALFQITDRHTQVRGLLFGHIHQDFEAVRKGVRLIGTPSTCLQFLPESDDFALDALPPAWRHLTLHPDGRIDTQVIYVDEPSRAMHSVSR
ncbi:3',5'-cyclic-AMP phosphodiesterase [Thioalkalivibrio sulfidiphilus]|uniref:Icc protein n=1 Tax=Thioalkalivibrio sulfidiphilus (strain HL-EbGR7) TaxID=396588 RepID=B8GLR4_THISH|nr:3',5'-cyclic-AMP phosphodiesterase [Thioalkalivibrio sulfidiphilus]ACL71667.1 Icc protein [Thioalkalivibrio sulfidiphilus HL-EbGr7]